MSLDPSQELTRIVVDAAKAIGCEIAGVDVMESDQGYIVNEVNSQPGWRGLQSTTNVDLAGSIADYLISKAR
jgi:glutathione synthase/RimK-type ligase-like ATP-grasp enzyme